MDEMILGLLPATRETLVSKRQKINPDLILWKLASLHRIGAVRQRWDGVFFKVEDEPDRPCTQSVKRGNPSPKPRQGTKTCPSCKTEYTGIRKHFGTHGKYCNKCRGNARRLGAEQMVKDKTCPSCNVTYRGVVDHFKRCGRLRATCNACGERDVRERIAARRKK